MEGLHCCRLRVPFALRKGLTRSSRGSVRGDGDHSFNIRIALTLRRNFVRGCLWEENSRRMPPKISLIGAGSVVFARRLRAPLPYGIRKSY